MPAETVLIIDDSDEIRALLENILSFANYQTLSATGGREGLNLAFTARPDVILLDLELPDIGGLKVLEELNHNHVAIPTIMMTGYGSEGVAARALRLGTLAYLIKPFTTEEVLAAVEKALSVGRLQEEKKHLSTLVERYLRHIRVISALGQAVVDGLDSASLLQRIVEAAQSVTRAERCWLSLLDVTTERFRIVAQRGKVGCTSTEFQAAAGAQSLWPALSQGFHVRLQAVPGSTIQSQTGDEVRALLQVPLRTTEGIIGLLSADRHKGEAPFGPFDEEALCILATYGILVLERNRIAEPEASSAL